MMNLLLRLRRFYWWLFRPQTRGVRAILRNSNGEVLLVQHSYGSGWYLPGGRVKKGESDSSALQRELFEETGIEVQGSPKLLGTYKNEQEFKKDTILVFLIDSFQSVRSSDKEIRDIQFFPVNQLPPEISPGTRRRIEEWQGKRERGSQW